MTFLLKYDFVFCNKCKYQYIRNDYSVHYVNIQTLSYMESIQHSLKDIIEDTSSSTIHNNIKNVTVDFLTL